MKQKEKQRVSKSRRVALALGGEPGQASDAAEIRVPADPKLLKIVRVTVAHFCELTGFGEEDCHNVTLAVDEACSNIIKHAYGGASRKPIIITMRRRERGLEVILRDYGTKVNPRRIKSRPLDEVRPGGLGVHLIRSVMDKVIYDNTLRDGNQLTLIKYLSGK